MVMKSRGFFVLLVLLSLAVAGPSWAADQEPLDRGLYLRSGDGEPFPAPTVGTAVEVRVTGIVARSRVTQIFTNPTPGWVEGIYVFPLPDGAAVDTLRMTVGDRVVEGAVREKKQAAAEYTRAKQEGRRASLVEFLRPGVFSTAVANLGPGETVEITLEMQQVVEHGHGRFSLRFPLTVPPRYAPQPADALPSPAPVAGPAAPSFAFHLDLAPGFPLGRIESSSHQIAVARDDRRHRYAVDLKDGVAPADSDLVLEWTPAVGREPRAVYFTEEIDGERYALLMVLPPDTPGAGAARLPRETVFVIDTSGSMEGTSLAQAKQALLLGLDRLAPGDAFNVIRFSSAASALFPQSVPVDPGSIARARAWVGALQVDGGTEMLSALQLSLPGQEAGTLLRQVIFATDGQVSNEAGLLAFINQHVGASRLFTVAIGPAPNAAFLRKAAALGRGTFTAIADTGQVASGMDDLFARIEAPMLRDVAVRWDDPAAEAWPERIPDLYLGEPVVVTARLSGGSGPVEIEGLRGGEPWQDRIPAAAEVRGAGLDKLWAGRKVEALLDSLAAGADADEVRREVTDLGLRYHLLTPHTSLVVADVEPVRPPQAKPVSYLIPGAQPPSGPSGGSFASSVDSDSLVSECIMVTAETPMLDERTISTGASVGQYEALLTAGPKDVWSVLAATPGVLTDRINMGGGHSGWQPAIAAGALAAHPATWSLDGVVITDLAALGADPAGYDLDALEEMQVTTAGGDPAISESGVVLNMVTKRGTNEWRAAGRLTGTAGGLAGDREDRVDALQAGSGDLGGPLRRDRAWIWTAASRTDEDRVVLGGGTEESLRDTATLKLNDQIASNNSITFLARRDEASGTGAGAAPHRAPETTWTHDGREDLWKIEDTHIVSSNFYLTAALAENRGASQSVPEAGSGGDGRIDAAGVARGSWFTRDEDRRTREAQSLAALFAQTGEVSHEIRLGAQARSLDVERLLVPPARLLLAGEPLGLPPGTTLAETWTGGRATAEVETRAAWAQDILSRDHATFSLGLRWDRQDLGLSGADPAEILAPRLGMTWAAGDDRQLLLRAALGRFASLLGAEPALAAAPEALTSRAVLLGPGGASTSAFATGPLALSPDLAPEITDEALLELEYALRYDIALGLQGTWRRTSDVLEERWLVRDAATGAVFAATSDDWLRAGRVDGSDWYDLRPGLDWTGRRLLANGDRRRDTFDLAAFWRKRMSERWMTRGHVAWHDWAWQTGPESTRFDDPTPALGGGDAAGQRVLVPFGDTVLPHEPARFLGSRWSFHAAGTVVLPRGISLSLAVDGREGTPLLWYRQVLRERAGLVRVPVSGPAPRTADLVTADFLLAKEINWSDLGLTLGLDVFNLLDTGTVAERELDLGASRAAQPARLVAPRTWQLGVRVSWR
jgi:Ca-activated chloride channel family protein